jgi:hypothetical protein
MMFNNSKVSLRKCCSVASMDMPDCMNHKSESEREMDCSEAVYSANPSNNALLVIKLWFLAGCSKG